ncbi:MAG: DUF721 domain-containing protein [Holosporales bacterium]|jgi:hypothetical protein|nr:DUF721 domain-containing protein [Holosporales bacterium]
MTKPTTIPTTVYPEIPTLGAHLRKVVAPAYKKSGFFYAGLILDWSKIVGPRYGSMCRPIRVSGKTPHCCLYVGASRSTATQLAYVTPQLIERIRQYIGNSAIETIRFVDDFVDSNDVRTPQHAANVRTDAHTGDVAQNANASDGGIVPEDLPEYAPLSEALLRLNASIEKYKNQ